MIEVRSSIEIEASAETVWRILTDLRTYRAWNPFIRHARGSLEVGGEVRVRVRPRFKLPLRFSARIVDRDERHELRWQGAFGGRWLARGDHRFTITPLGDRRVRFEQAEVFDGIVPRLGKRLLAREVEAGFAAMNTELALRAERAELAEIAEDRAGSAPLHEEARP